FLLAFVLAGQVLMAQPKPTDLDKSPMDISYYPENYPILKMRAQANGEPLARIIYSRPQLKGRDIFGQEVKYNQVWRLGANEATELELFKNATIGGKRIPKGRYVLYCIPTEKKWTIIVNKDNYSWGSFTYKSDKDVARIDVPVQKNDAITEALTIYFEKSNLILLWENIKASVPVSF
ncbi:MAG TPA: DUF2911 domain-containing protein, partial [Segetibacter sp.]|nr:DUF2911 domain-containing protein [Segetibacter sp.]